MARLIVAVGHSLADQVEEALCERTAGTWRKQVRVERLHPTEKVRNNGDVENLARNNTTAQVLVAANLTSSALESQFPNVRRLPKDRLVDFLYTWLASSGLSWRENAEECKRHGSYTWGSVEDWCRQFERVDPVHGRRVAAAILVQLKIVTSAEMAQWFDGLTEVDHNLYYIGSDPHSGDHSLVNVLSARIDGPRLSDVLDGPALQKDAKVRLFSDAAWSGGETGRRLECLYRECDKKRYALGKENELYLRLAYLTDSAETTIDDKIEQLNRTGICSYRRIKVTCPEGNKLAVNPTGKSKGLAFQRTEILEYVSPTDSTKMKSLCRQIGRQINSKRPLGTDDIASTIAFEYSLPRAMLPVLIFGGAKITAHDGSVFNWKPLLLSKHVENPAKSNDKVHCEQCPLVPVKKPQSTIVTNISAET